MNIYYVEHFNFGTYGMYHNFVVIAPNEETARNTHPSGGIWCESDWCKQEDVEKLTLRKLGTSDTTELEIVTSVFIEG